MRVQAGGGIRNRATKNWTPDRSLGSSLRYERGEVMKAKLTIGIPVWLDKICVWPVLLYRLWKYGYTYRRIYLGEGLFTLVDSADYYWLNNFFNMSNK